MANNMSVEAKIDKLAERFDRVESRLDSLEQTVGALATRFDRFEGKVKVEFEDTRHLIRLGFEKMEGFEQSVGGRFDTVDKKLDDLKIVHDAAIIHVRKRVEGVEKRRGR